MSETESDNGHYNRASSEENFYEVVGRKSWVPYFFLILKYSLIFALVVGIQSSTVYQDITITSPEVIFYTNYVYIAIGVPFLYRFAVLRSFKIYVVQRGVYYEEGIRLFPWWRHGDGIRWKDMDMSFFRNNFISWITNSYAVMVNHKYTNNSDFEVTHIWSGKSVSGKIEGFRERFLEGD